jgi:fumarate hydratase class II
VAGSLGQFELNVFKPVIIHNFLQSARLLGDAARSFTNHCITGLCPDLKTIDTHLSRSLMAVTALNPHIGYDNAARVAKQAHEQGISLKQAAQDLGLVSPETFDRLVDFRKMVRPRGES